MLLIVHNGVCGSHHATAAELVLNGEAVITRGLCRQIEIASIYSITAAVNARQGRVGMMRTISTTGKLQGVGCVVRVQRCTVLRSPRENRS